MTVRQAGIHELVAKGIKDLAKGIKADHPTMSVHLHLHDAAAQLALRNKDGALRHLSAAMSALQPQSLYRHGLLDDDDHMKAKANMDAIGRHALRLHDVSDLEMQHEANLYGDQQPVGNQAMNAPAHIGAGGSGGAAAGPTAPIGHQGYFSRHLSARPWAQAVSQSAGGSLVGMSNAYALSAQTGHLASTPAPLGRPGGPGLYGVKGNKHSDYMEQVVKALIEKRGMTREQAYRVAWGALRRWRAGGGKVHPEVKAAAGGALAEERAAAARSRAVHSHTWEEADQAIELAGSSWQNQPRVPKGAFTGGQWTKGGGGTQSAATPPGATPRDHRAALKARLLARAAADDRMIVQLKRQLRYLVSQLYPRYPAASQTAYAAAAGRARAAAAATAAGQGTQSAVAQSNYNWTRANLQAQIRQIRGEIGNLVIQAANLRAQAARL